MFLLPVWPLFESVAADITSKSFIISGHKETRVTCSESISMGLWCLPKHSL